MIYWLEILQEDKTMKYQICYIDKSVRGVSSQTLESFSEFQEFRKRYHQLHQNPIAFHIQGVSVYRTSKDELHEIVLMDKDRNFILMYKSTEFGIDALISLTLGSHFDVLDSSLFYDIVD